MSGTVLDIEACRVQNILHTMGLGNTHIDVKIAWEMPGVELQLTVHELEYVFEELSWERRTMMAAAPKEPHWSLILEADLSYPIIVTQEPYEDRLTVIDGRHRLMKAWLLGEKLITAKMLSYTDLLEQAVIASEVVERAVCVVDVLGDR